MDWYINNVMENKGIFRIISIILGAAIIVTSACLIFFIYEYRASEDRYEEIRLEAIPYREDAASLTEESEDTITYNPLYDINSDYIGWIEACEGEIDYPMVRGEDNEFYLKHDFDGNRASCGCIFADCEYGIPFEGALTVLYGHNMRDGSMFHSLLNYKDREYCLSHPFFYITTDEGRMEVQIFSVFKSDYADIPFYQGEILSDAYISELKGLSMYDMGVIPEAGDKLVMLITCEYSTSDGRMVICGELHGD